MNTNNKFFQLPHSLFQGIYVNLSTEGKLLYSLLLNRRSLSKKNNLTDAQGKTIVYFTNKEVCDKLRCGHDKGTKLFRELESFRLISRCKQGRGKPDIIYVMDLPHCEKAAPLNCEKQESGVSVSSTFESEKLAGSNTDNNTESSHTDPSISYEEIEEMIKEQIEYDILSERDYVILLDEIVSLITDTYCTAESFVRISKRQISAQTFRVRISKLTAEHIEYVIQSLEKMSPKLGICELTF